MWVAFNTLRKLHIKQRFFFLNVRRSSDSVKLSIAETDGFREMLNYIADRERFENTERQLNDFIAESFKRHLTLIEAYINTTNEIHEFIELAGKNLRVGKIRQILHKTDVQCNEIIQQFGWMFKYIDAKLMQSNCSNVTAMSDYENQLVNLQLSLNKCEIHKKNRKSANLVRKIRTRINSLIDKIKNVEKKVLEDASEAINGILNSEFNVDDEDDNNDEDSVFDENYWSQHISDSFYFCLWTEL